MEFVNPWERQMLSPIMDEHSGCLKLNRKETTKQQTYICNAKQESKKLGCLLSLIHD
jgi:hypothetical protein